MAALALSFSPEGTIPREDQDSRVASAQPQAALVGSLLPHCLHCRLEAAGIRMAVGRTAVEVRSAVVVREHVASHRAVGSSSAAIRSVVVKSVAALLRSVCCR